MNEELKEMMDVPDQEEGAEQGSPTAEASETPDLQETIQLLEKENMRLRADMENLRKRAQKEKMDFARYANESLLCEIIPVCDNFDRATQVRTQDPEVEKFLKGFQMIQGQLEHILKEAGLEKIEASQQPFDPNLHEAVEVVEGEGGNQEIVAEVLRPGYRYKEKVIRPALVKVVKE